MLYWVRELDNTNTIQEHEKVRWCDRWEAARKLRLWETKKIGYMVCGCEAVKKDHDYTSTWEG